jgi:hypothetical protein
MSDTEFLPQEGPKAFIRVWRKVMSDPRGFYGEMPSSGGFENPLIFLAICGLFYLILKIIVSETLTSAIWHFFLVVLAYALGPGILMLVAQSLFQGEGDYEGTVRVCAYAGATLVLAWVPYLGALAFIYAFYLMFLGTEKVHRLNRTDAALTVLIAVPVVALVLVFVLGKRVLQYVF